MQKNLYYNDFPIIRRVVPFLLLLLILHTDGIAQNSKSDIANLTFEALEMEGTKIVVYYDIIKSSPIETFSIELAFVDDEDYYYYPKSVTGDVGPGIQGGKGKRIIWDVFKDVEQLGRVKAIINIASVSVEPGGPLNALLSIPVPGFGDIYVKNMRTSMIKPWHKTAAAYGLVGYGLYQKSRSNSYYSQYLESENRGEFDELYKSANSANHRFIISTVAGTAIWISDIAWVLYRGLQNKNNGSSNNEVLNDILISPNSFGGVSIGYVYGF